MNLIKKMLSLKKEWMMKNGVKRGIILAVISLFSFQVTFAQRITRQYNNVSFSAALKDLNARQDKYSINFVYDELEDFKVTKSIRNQSVPDAIQQLIGFYPIKMKVIDHVIIVECMQKSATKMIGRIVDEHHRPVDFANVALLSVGDSTFITGGVTNENGQFVIPCEAKRAIVKVSCVGYQTLSRTYNIGRIGNVTMKEATLNLQKVVVKGHRQAFKMTSEGLVAQVEGTVLENMGSAKDVLRHLPRVMQTDGKLEVLGKGTPLIYIDNKKVMNSLELDRLTSSNIKHVEVITEPGAEYDATYPAVIKIKTVRKQGDGLGLKYRQVYQRNHENSHSEMLDLNYRHHGLDVFSTLFYRLFQGDQDQHNDTKAFGKTLMHVKEDLTIKNKSDYFSGSLGFNYVFNEKHSLGATYEGNINPYGRGGWNSEMNVWKNGRQSDHLLNEYAMRYKPRPTHDVTAYYVGQIGKVNVDWNGEYYKSEIGQTQVSNETEKDGGDKRVIQSDYSADSWMYASKLVLSVPLWKGSFKIGNEYTSSCRANLYTIDEQGDNLPGKTDDQVKETNLATFFSYALRWNQVDMNVGLRYEHVSSNYLNLGKNVWDEAHTTSLPDLSRKYDNFFPNVSISFPVKDVKVSTSYRVVVTRPSYRELSSNVQYNSRYFYQGGNPLLQPTYEHVFSLNVGYKWLQLFANCRYIENASYWCIEPYEDSEQIYMFSYRNLKHSQSCTVGLTAAPKIGWWQPQLNMSMRKQMMKIGDMSYNKPLFIGSLNNTFEIPAGWVLNIDMDYRGRGHYSTIDYKQQGGVDVSLRKGFFHNRLNIMVEGIDVFASRRQSTRFVFGTVDNSVWKYTDTRKFLCSISYKLNASRSKYKGTGAGKAEKSRM